MKSLLLLFLKKAINLNRNISVFIFLVTFISCKAQPNISSENNSIEIYPGAYQTNKYLPLLENKKVAVVVNQTSVVNQTHIVDSLQSLKINIKKIFAPEHGFRGNDDAGAFINNSLDSKSKLPIISLYGNKKGPDSTDLADVDIVIFDIQDVGCRFYTFISTLEYVMESCARYHKKLIVFDRPNPNAFYIDGPILEKEFKSFVGMQQIPVVYGMTISEYALMLNGEHWLKDSLRCDLSIIQCENYTHKSMYKLPIPPSPNLKTMTSIYLYPTLCFFEGTQVSVGRGTDKPFECIGYPGFLNGKYKFTPVPKSGASTPMYMNEECSGFDLSYYNTGYFVNKNSIFLSYIIDMYKTYPNQSKFFNDFFDKLAGTNNLRDAIISGKNEYAIRTEWKEGIDSFKLIRAKYLLYVD